jgi:hypothetical protein
MRKIAIVIFALATSASVLFSEASISYRICEVKYDIVGRTRQYPLSQAVPIDTERLFYGQKSLDAYIRDIDVQLANQRVFDSVSVDTAYGEADESGVVGVTLTVHTKDTWNLIALPYPKYDSNEGLELKFKLKNYNFLGSMQTLDGEAAYQLNNGLESTFTTTLSFDIPFAFCGYAFNWRNTATVSFPIDEVPEYNISTGLSMEVPISITKIVFGLDQSVAINDRNDDSGEMYDDRLYFIDAFSASVPFVLYSSSITGNLTLSPFSKWTTNLAFDGIQSDDLKGSTFDWGVKLDIGRVNWVGNLRSGFLGEISNEYSYNVNSLDTIDITLKGNAVAYSSFFDRVGVNSRVIWFYNLNERMSESIADTVRGIYNSRVDSDTAVSLNLDFPINVLDADFEEITGVKWTRYVSFEMQAAPFIDVLLAHDPVTGRYFNLTDGWYSGGLEIIVFPRKMRSIYVRASAGIDIVDFVESGYKLRSVAARDDKSTREFSFGIGLFY